MATEEDAFLNHRPPSMLPKFGHRVRYIQAAIFFFYLLFICLTRSHMGVTIVAMVNVHNEVITSESNHTENIIIKNKTIDFNNNNDSIEDEDLDNVNLDVRYNNITSNITEEASQYVFDWSKSTQQMVLGSFYFGYFIMTFPMAMVCQRWGGKIPLQIACLGNGIISIITPWLTSWGDWKAMCGCQFLQGVTQSGTYPGLHTLLAKWVPANERAKLTSYVYSGTSLGNILAFQMSALLCHSGWGWPSIFWIIGVLNLCIFGVLTAFASATPQEHPTIGAAEKHLILATSNTRSIRDPKVPWKAIITSKPTWGAIATHSGSGFGFIFYVSQVPSYIHDVLGVDIINSGLLSSLPLLGMAILGISFGWLSDYVTNKKIVSKKNARRIFNSISQFGVAFSLICVSYTNSTIVAVICFIVSRSFDAGIECGWMVNYIDLAPNYCGTLMSIGNTFMNICNILVPTIVSFVIIDATNVLQWRTMFFIIAGVCLITNAIFVLLVSVETQSWNYVHNNEVEDEPETHLMMKRTMSKRN